MQFNLEQWVENIKQKPESVRFRYVLGCVAITMLLVLGVWSLSVTENFRSVSSGAHDATEATQGLIPRASNFTLDSLLSGEKSLEDRKKEVSGELFFQQQLEKKEGPNFADEGYVPQDTKAPSSESSSNDSNSR